MMKSGIRIGCLLALMCGCVGTMAADWQLKGINGHQPSFWDDKAPNWKWDDGNPAKDNGAQWLLFYQPDNDPGLGSAVKPMLKGLAWKYNRVWRDDSDKADPLYFYIGSALTCASRQGHGLGSAAGLMFIPDQGGKYKVAVSGKVKVQNPSAGNARVSIFLLDRKTGDASLLKEYELNSKGGYGSLPETFTWNQSIAIPEGNALAVRVQSVNPGPGSCGKSTLSFSGFKVIKE